MNTQSVRVSGNAVRLAALVAAATTSGYLWRAALEAPAGTTIIRLAPSAPPQVHVIAAPHDPASSAPAATGHATHPVAARPRTRTTPRVAAPAPATHVAPPSRPATPSPSSSPAPKPSPAPTPPPKPSQPPPPTTSQPPPTASPPVTASQQPPPPSSQPPTDSGDSSDSSKPGWGHGDKNHDHDGPPGGGKHD